MRRRRSRSASRNAAKDLRIETFSDVWRIVEKGRELPPPIPGLDGFRLPQDNALRILTRGHPGIVSLINSHRFPPLCAHSPLEADFYTRIEVDRSVTAVVHQPLRITWRDPSGRQRSHVPDAALEWGGRIVVVEIKHHERTTYPDFLIRTETLVEMAATAGVEYRVVTDKWIREEPYLGNAKHLVVPPLRLPGLDEITAIQNLLELHPAGLNERDIADALGQRDDFVYIVRRLAMDAVLVLARPDAPIDVDGRFILPVQK